VSAYRKVFRTDSSASYPDKGNDKEDISAKKIANGSKLFVSGKIIKSQCAVFYICFAGVLLLAQ